MKRIVYIVGGLLAPNGMSTVLSNKINYLAEHTDYELYMILTEKAGTPWYYTVSEKVRWVNFDVNFDELDTMPIAKKLYYYFLKQKKYKRKLTNYLMEVKPDVTVSAVRREINFINDIPDGSKKVGEIHFDRTSYRQFHVSWLPEFVNQFVTKRWTQKLIKNLKRLSCFVVLTHEDYGHWPELNNKIVIPNSLHFFPEQKATLKNKAAIAVGRYSWQKGFDLLIQAWCEVAKKHPDWILDIYGAGDHSSFQRLADEKGLSGSVFCHSAVNDIYAKYRESSIFVLSSRYEGFGLVLAEAMSVGLPAVSFACPCGPSDIVTPGCDGILVEPENVQALADGICSLIENKKLRLQYGSSAQKNMHRYEQKSIMQQWINLFESL